jgi:hypothetical protein
MHTTHASPGTAEYYRKTGKFPDGAVLVKEVMGTDHAQLTTGDAHWASGTKVWFIKIKDEKHRFPQNALWVTDGDGFFTNPMHPTSRWRMISRKIISPVTSRPSQRNWTYVQGFPVPKSKQACNQLNELRAWSLK